MTLYLINGMHVPQEENVFKTTELHSSVISLAKHLQNMHRLCTCVPLSRCICTNIVYLHNVYAPKDRVAIIYSHCSSAHYKISCECEGVQELGNILPTIINRVFNIKYSVNYGVRLCRCACTYRVYLHNIHVHVHAPKV